jgi:hypothetical protein
MPPVCAMAGKFRSACLNHVESRLATNNMMFSQRFQLTVVITGHAKQRMLERDINDALLMEIIETGTDKDAGNGHHWVFKHVMGRSDNLLCVAAVVDNVFVVKTIMHHWELDS